MIKDIFFLIHTLVIYDWLNQSMPLTPMYTFLIWQKSENLFIYYLNLINNVEQVILGFAIKIYINLYGNWK